MKMWQLQQKQSLPLEAKIILTQEKIRWWYEHWQGDVYVSFSGGKDSTVLLDIARGLYPKIPAVFIDTELEYPEIRQFVKTVENVTFLKPRKGSREIIVKHGYPVVSKEQAGYIEDYRKSKNEARRHRLIHGDEKGRYKISKKWQFLVNAPFKVSDQCCYNFKKAPIRKYEKTTGYRPILGVMASDSNMRRTHYFKYGCNAFDLTRPMSMPLSVWLEDDIWDYLHRFNVPYSKIYDMGYYRTGCMFCMFGVHMEKRPNRFEMMKKTHPKQWHYCMYKLGFADVLEYIGVPYGVNEQLSVL